MEKTPADVLEEAADLLLIHGRCRYALREDDGSFCAVGALITAAVGDDSLTHDQIARHPTVARMPEYLRAWTALSRRAPGSITAWNNDPTTTDDEVRDTLLLAAKDLRGQAVPK